MLRHLKEVSMLRHLKDLGKTGIKRISLNF